MRSTSLTLSSLAVGLLVGTLNHAAASSSATPDPKLVLQGVESLRLQIPPARLKLRYTYKNALVTNQSILDVDFAGERHAFSFRPQPPAKGWQAVFDGTKVITYGEGQRAVDLRNRDQEEGVTLFDPRTLGLSTGYNWLDDVESCIPLRWAVRAELIGRERIGDHLAWHVRLVMPFPGNIPQATAPIPPYDYWIDSDNSFRVYRTDNNGEQSLSFYKDIGSPWLPTRVTTTMAKNYKLLGTEIREWEIIDAKWSMTFPASRWELASLGLKPQTDVIDDRIQRRVGFWNGTRYVPLHPELEQRSPRAKLVTWLVCLALILIPPLIMWWRRSRAASR